MTSDRTDPGVTPPQPQPETPVPPDAPPPPAAPPPLQSVAAPTVVATPPTVVPTPPPVVAPPSPASVAPSPDPMYRARQAWSLLDPTGLRPTGIVLGVIAALFFGSQIVNALIPAPSAVAGPGTGPGSGPLPPFVAPTTAPGPGTGPLPPGSVLTAGPLRIPLVAGWQPVSNPSSSAVASLVKGAVQIDLFSATITGGTGTPAGVYNTYMSFIGQNATGFTSAPPGATQIGAGLPAARGAYTGVFGQSQIDGEVTTFVTGTTDGWVWDAWGPPGTLGGLLPEVRSMIDNIQLVGGG